MIDTESHRISDTLDVKQKVIGTPAGEIERVTDIASITRAATSFIRSSFP